MEVGVIGTGLMGLPMAQRILDESLPLIAYNRTASKLEPLRAQGAAIAPTPECLIRSSSCIVLMLTNAPAIHEVLLSDASRAELKGKTVIQMGTISPSESRSLNEAVIAAQAEYLEAPVLGSIPEAKVGKLLVMVGSTPEQFEQWQDVLQCFGEHPIYVGEVGTAAALKLALNQLIGSLTTAFATSLEFVRQQGVPVEILMQVLRTSALYAPTFDKKLQRMVDGNYENPNFPTKHLQKDLGLFQTEATHLGLNTQIVTAVQDILDRTIEQGLAEADYAALLTAIQP